MKLLLNKLEAANTLSISTTTLQRLVNEGKLRETRIGARVLFKMSDLELFTEQLSSGQFEQKKRGRPRLAV
mgnify:CR=1 FL=1